MAHQLKSRAAHQSFTGTRTSFTCATHLLIVQRNPLLARSLSRYLSDHYEHVCSVTAPEDAEVALADGRAHRWHLVCGQDFDGLIDGISCISRLRLGYPGIVRAVLATACDALPPLPSSIDGVFHKPNHPAELLALLHGPSRLPLPTSLQHAATFEEIMKTTIPKTHDLKTLKERAALISTSKSTTTTVASTAQGFTVA
jgi:DNA-binding response OmpR family regulator